MKTNRTNWIKLSEHETESFTHTLRYFTLLGRSWFGQYIFWKWCTVETLFCIRLCCYLNSTVALCKFPFIWWEFEEFTHWLGGCIDGVWSLHALVVLRICSIISWSCYLKVKEQLLSYEILCWYQASQFFCISRQDDFNLHLAWHYRHVKPPKRVATKHPPSQFR